MKKLSSFLVVLAVALLVLPVVAGAGFIMDESSSGLVTLGAASIGYLPLATPNDGSTPNAFQFVGTVDGFELSMGLTAGKTYTITTRNQVLFNHMNSFYVDLGNTTVWNNGYTVTGASDIFETKEILGYYKATGAATARLHDGAEWCPRVDWVSVEETTDVYFDELTSDLALTGDAGLASVGGESLSADTEHNAIWFSTLDTISGTVALNVGTTYNVYASRFIHDTGNLGYDITLEGTFFAHDSATTAVGVWNDRPGESLIGEYTAIAASTDVLLHNGGAWGSRSDYLRFEAVPEPATMLLLLSGLMFARKKK